MLDLKKRRGLFLAATLAGDLITNLLAGALVVTWLEDTIRHALRAVPLPGEIAATAASVAAFVTASYFILVFGDLAPKSVALSAPERAAMVILLPLRLLGEIVELPALRVEIIAVANGAIETLRLARKPG